MREALKPFYHLLSGHNHHIVQPELEPDPEETKPEPPEPPEDEDKISP